MHAQRRAVGSGGAGLGEFFLSYHWNIRKRADLSANLGSLGGQMLAVILLLETLYGFLVA